MPRFVSRVADLWRGHPALDALLLAFLSFPGWAPLLRPGHPGGHDSLFHLFRLVELDRLIRAGFLYPRLAPDLALGYDYPVFNFYAPLAIYLAEVPRLLGLGYVDAVKVALALGVVAAGPAMYLFAREVMPRLGAFVAGLAYAFLPYLLVDVYVRGALAEATALPLLPVCLWAWRRLAGPNPPTPFPAGEGGAGRIAVAALCLAALLLTHNVTSLMFAPVLGLYWLFAVLTDRRAGSPLPPGGRGVGGVRSGLGRSLPPAVFAGLIGLAVAAFYWLPALAERDLVASGQLTKMFFDYHEQFQPLGQIVQRALAYEYVYDWERRILFRAGLVQVAIAGLGIAVALLRGGRARREGAFWGAVLVAALVLQTSRTAALWDAVPLAAFLQFPWRLLALVGLASALLAGQLAAAVAERVRPRALALSIVLLLAGALVGSALADLRPSTTVIAEADLRPETMQRLEADRKQIAATTGEYLPRWAEVPPFAFGSLPPAVAPIPPAKLTLRSAGVFDLELDVAAERSTSVTLDRFYFPGWLASVDGREAAVRPAGPLGLLAVDVPAGEHRLRVSFGDAPVRAAATALSAIGLLALLGLAGVSVFGTPFPRGEGGRGVRSGRVRCDQAVADQTVMSLVERGLVSRRWAVGGRRRVPAILVFALVLVGALGSGLWTESRENAARAEARAEARVDLAADFGPSVRLIGVAVGDATNGSSGGALDLTLYWQALARPGPASDGVVALRLLDASGRVVGARDKRPQYGARPTSLWEANEVVRDRQAIALNPGVTAGEYDLVVGLRDAAAGAWLPPTGGDGAAWQDELGSGVGVRLGRVRLAARETVSLAPLPRPLDARFGGQIALAGFGARRLGAVEAIDAALPLGDSAEYLATIGQGESLALRLRLAARRDVDRDYAVFVHLLDAKQRLAAQDDEWPHRGFRPTSLLLPGETVDTEYVVRVPKDLTPGRYTLSVGLYERATMRRLPLDGSDKADQFSLGAVKVVASPPLTAATLAPRKPLDAKLGGQIDLLGYDLRSVGKLGAPNVAGEPVGSLKSGEATVVRLYWRAGSTPSADYTVFIHLYQLAGEAGPPRAQADGQPGEGGYPTRLWSAGEIVVDDHPLELPPGLAPGRYRLEVGLYLLATGERLKLADGTDRVVVDEVIVDR